MNARNRNILTGAVVLGALITLLWMLLTFSGAVMRIFKPNVTVVFFRADRADGLSKGSPVFYKGVEVGKVTAVHRLPDNQHVLIEGELDNRPPLPHNLLGLVKAQSPLGNSGMIDLTTDGAANGAVESNQEIQVAFVGQSIFPPEFNEMLNQASKQELVKHVDEAIVELGKQIKKMGDVIDSTNKVIGDPKVQQDFAMAMANVRQVTERANTIAVNLEKLTVNADASLAEVKTQVTATLARTDKNLDRLTLKIDSDLEKLGETFHQFQQISAKINAGKGTAGALINDPKLYEELTLTAKQLKVVATSLARLVDQWEHEGVFIKMSK